MTWIAGPPAVAQLSENFEAATVAELSVEDVGPGATLSTGSARFGVQGVHLDNRAGQSLARWSAPQISTGEQCTAFLLAGWVRHTEAPAWVAGAPSGILGVHDTAGSRLAGVAMLPAGAGLGLVGAFADVPLAAPVVGEWDYLEVRGVLDGTWLFELRRNGVLTASATGAGTLPVDVGAAGLGSTVVATGTDKVVVDGDRLWLITTGEGDPVPGWWSDTAGYDGAPPPLVLSSADLVYPFTAALAAPVVVHEVGVDTNLDVTVAHADGSVVDQPAPFLAVRPAGVNPTRVDFPASTWVTDADVERVARIVLGPSGLVLAAGVHRVWALYDWSSAPPDWPKVLMLIAQPVLVV